MTLALCSCAAVTLAAAMIGQRWQLVIFAAPLIGVLASSCGNRHRRGCGCADTPIRAGASRVKRCG